jgi:hypothetical protein
MAIVAVSVLAYLVVGIANAVLIVLNDGEPKDESRGILIMCVLLWPIGMMIDWPVWIARRIKARQAARCEKPAVFSEYDEENR